MKKLLTIVLFLIIFCLSSCQKHFGYEALRVVNDYEEGLEMARIEDKPIFLYFTLHGSSVRSFIVDEQILGDWKTYKKLAVHQM